MCNNGKNEQDRYKAEDFIDENTWLPNFKEFDKLPFKDHLEAIFVNPKSDIQNFPIHGPNTIRIIYEILDGTFENDSDYGEDVKKELRKLMNFVNSVFALDQDEEQTKTPEKWEEWIKNKRKNDYDIIDASKDSDLIKQAKKLVKVAALYHDIGKSISNSNHPQIGVNILRNIRGSERMKLVEKIGDEDFSLLCSMIQHHDKFGNLCTGEASLPILSDVLYFTSSQKKIVGALKNVTSVMLLNLADMAAVCTYKDSEEDDGVKIKEAWSLVKEIRKCVNSNNTPEYSKKADLFKEKLKETRACRGLISDDVKRNYEFFLVMVEQICESKADRQKLKRLLIKYEQKPVGLINRMRNLLTTVIKSIGGEVLSPHFSDASIESVLSGLLDTQFEDFCNRFALVVKMGYAKRFFQIIARTEIRIALGKKTEVTPVFTLEGIKNWAYIINKLKKDNRGEFESLLSVKINKLDDKIEGTIEKWALGELITDDTKAKVVMALNEIMATSTLYGNLSGYLGKNSRVSYEFKRYLRNLLKVMKTNAIKNEEFLAFIDEEIIGFDDNGDCKEMVVEIIKKHCEKTIKEKILRDLIPKYNNELLVNDRFSDLKGLLLFIIDNLPLEEVLLFNRLLIESIYTVGVFDNSQLYDIDVFSDFSSTYLTREDISDWDVLKVLIDKKVKENQSFKDKLIEMDSDEIFSQIYQVNGNLIHHNKAFIISSNNKRINVEDKILEVLNIMLKSPVLYEFVLNGEYKTDNSKMSEENLASQNRKILSEMFGNAIKDAPEEPEKLQLDKLSKVKKQLLADTITARFAEIIYRLLHRYSDILDPEMKNNRRIGFQMSTLTREKEVSKKIAYLLSNREKRYTALSWITDEVSIWSFD